MKVALIGSAPSSVRLAPYGDSDWKVWGCSPGVYGIAPRVDAWFELHRYEPGQSWFSPEYCQWMNRLKVPLYMAEVRVEQPASVRLPQEELVAKYGPYFFTSSLAWMMAMAIEQGATTIGLWGVDMAATEEYGYQRAGCQFFAMLAASRGIEVGVPPESDLFRPMPLYGVDEIKHSSIKTLARRRELESRLAQAVHQKQELEKGEHFLKGALDDLNYVQNTWADQRDSYVSPPKVPALAALAAVELTPSVRDAFVKEMFATGPGPYTRPRTNELEFDNVLLNPYQ